MVTKEVAKRRTLQEGEFLCECGCGKIGIRSESVVVGQLGRLCRTCYISLPHAFTCQCGMIKGRDDICSKKDNKFLCEKCTAEEAVAEFAAEVVRTIQAKAETMPMTLRKEIKPHVQKVGGARRKKVFQNAVIALRNVVKKFLNQAKNLATHVRQAIEELITLLDNIIGKRIPQIPLLKPA